MIRIGVDIGGTFTDFVVWRDDGDASEIQSFKVPSRPGAYHQSVIEGLERLVAGGRLSHADPLLIIHGTTVSTNTVIERTGAALALLVTEGFRDLLNIQRLKLDKAVDLFNARTQPLIRRERVYPIAGRMSAFGRVLTPLDKAAVAEIGEVLLADGITDIVVAFLHSYRNPAHEDEAAEVLAQLDPRLSVTRSSAISPQPSEYERAMVAILNAYVQDSIRTYIGEISGYLERTFADARLYVTRSNGGVMSSQEAISHPVHTMLSGPASGVSAAAHVAKLANEQALLTMDMGGTSTDLSLVLGSEPLVSLQGWVGDFPLNMPVTGIEAIGAGGGSLARLDGPVLVVGPESAGAYPGPACYGRGGDRPTLTDAYVVCGYINPATFLGGRMPLDADLARRAIKTLARQIGTGVPEAAEACVNVATSNMSAKVLPYLARLGVNPRELALLVYGGAGTIHGGLLAEEIGIERILVPPTPSVFCAYGGIVAPLMHDVNRTIQGMTLSGGGLRAVFEALEEAADAWLAAQIDPVHLERREFQHFLEARYSGQAFNVTFQLPCEMLAACELGEVERLFHAEHRRLYTHADEAAAVELIEARVRVLGGMHRPPERPVFRRDEIVATVRARRARFGGAWHDTAALPISQVTAEPIAGPAIIECGDTSIVVPPGFRASADDRGFIELRRQASR